MVDVNDIEFINTMSDRFDTVAHLKSITNPIQEVLTIKFEVFIIILGHPIGGLLCQALERPTSFHFGCPEYQAFETHE